MADAFIDVPRRTTAAQLQTMNDSAAEGTTFVLQAGMYSVDRTVTINQSDVALMGQVAAKPSSR